jgi:Ca2+-binding EF-hand superfamily protein
LRKAVPNSTRQFRELLRHFLDKNDDDRIDEAEFVAGWGFVSEQLELLEDTESKFVLGEIMHNISEEAVEELLGIYTNMAEDLKAGTFDEGAFIEKMQLILGYDPKHARAMMHMLEQEEEEGELTFKEFIKAQSFFFDGEKPIEQHAAPCHVQRELTAAQLREAKAIYHSFDANGDGILDADELRARMADFGWSDRQVEKTIAEVDVDHDGRVTLEEFVSTYLEFLAS